MRGSRGVQEEIANLKPGTCQPEIKSMADVRATALMWSGGKDATLALEALRSRGDYRVEALVTTVIEEAETVTMHGVPLALVEAQVAALRLPLHVMRVPPSPSNTTYEERLERTLAPLLARRITTVAAGDVFLEDVRAYRADLLRRLGAEPLFPIWGRDTAALARHFVEAGFRAVVTSVDTEQLAADFVGRTYDADFLRALPETVDPCGERGEFHTFVYDGPPFAHAVSVTVGAPHGRGQMRYAGIASGE